MADQASAQNFLVANAFDLMDFSLDPGSDFNPKNTEWQENPFAAYPAEVWKYEESGLYEDRFFMDIDESYHDQLDDSDMADQAVIATLDEIETSLTEDGEELRYDKSVYLTFRDNLMGRTFESDDMYNSRLGEKTVAYVYFTNATDDEGVHHPFMVIASHNASDGPNFLIDVPRPPGADDNGGYAEQSITRNAVLEVKLVRIPLKDYGLVDNLTDNDFTVFGTLASDMNLDASEYDVYNYASRASSGIATDGVVIYPAYNNNLRFAALDAEITSTGIHVGRGMGLHYHADGHGYNQSGINLYNIQDFEGYNHPPMIGFSYDGIALFGRYETSYAEMEGYNLVLDEFGGHDHGDLGYHYHAFGEEVNYSDEMGTVDPFTQHFLLVGAWRGNINDIPGMLEGSTAQLKDPDIGRYAGASYTQTEQPEVPGAGEILNADLNGDGFLEVYPVPTNGVLNIRVSQAESIGLLDYAGRFLLRRTIVDGSTQFDMSGLSPGMYFICVELSGQKLYKRVIRK